MTSWNIQEHIETWVQEQIKKATCREQINSTWRVWILFTTRDKDYLFDYYLKKYGKENLQTNNMR